MKKILMCLSVITLSIAAQSAFADHRHYRGGYNSYGGAYYSGRHYYPSHRYRGDSYVSVSFGNRYGYYGGHRHYDSGAFVGGVLLGSLLSYPRYAAPRYQTVRYVSRPATRTREVVYLKQSPAGAAPGRRLLRDLQGNCFERITDANGDEIRVQLDRSECAF